MSTNENQLAERPSVKGYLELPTYKARFGEILGPVRAPKFMAALVALSSEGRLAECDPRSVIASALVAATLDLPIEKSLGFAHVVPYGGVAQFQMAAKGYVQLALRSGQYARLNAKPVNAEVVGDFDEVGEPKIDWSKLDETKPVVGYVVAWKLVNGFVKVAYWSVEKVEDHAARFSKAYQAKKKDSPWFTNFDKMALKTVLMNELRAYGPLSVEMQTAMKHDNGAQSDLDADVDFVDREEKKADEAGGKTTRAAAPEREKKGAATVKKNPVKDNVVEGEFTEGAQPGGQQNTTTQGVLDKTTPPADEKQPGGTPAATTPATTPATTSPAAEAAKTEPAKPPVRALLKPAEELEAICTVTKIIPTMLDLDRVNAPSVEVHLDGEYHGPALHHKGGTGDAKLVTPLPVWAVGNTVKVKLFGRQFKTGIRAMVLAVEPAAKGMVLE